MEDKRRSQEQAVNEVNSSETREEILNELEELFSRLSRDYLLSMI